MKIPESKPLPELDNDELIILFKVIMDRMTRTNNAQSLIDLARAARDAWSELENRGQV